MSARPWAACALACLAACGAREAAPVPGVEDVPELGRAVRKDLPELIPAYGIAEAGGSPRFVVNVEAEDAPRLRPGQAALVSVAASSATIKCRVTRVLRGASAETDQALAWLSPVAPGGGAAPNDFVTAQIELSRRRVLTVPRNAVMIRDGRTMVLRASPGEAGKTAYAPVLVVTGLAAGGDVEIASGLKEGDDVVVSGGIGLLFPEFKAAGD